MNNDKIKEVVEEFIGMPTPPDLAYLEKWLTQKLTEVYRQGALDMRDAMRVEEIELLPKGEKPMATVNGSYASGFMDATSLQEEKAKEFLKKI